MSKSCFLAQILAYVAENKVTVGLEAEFQEMMAIEATKFENFESGQHGQEITSESRRLDCIYDDKPLRFEKDPFTSIKRMQAQDPLEEIDFGDGSTKRPTHISAKIDPTLKAEVINMLKKSKDCFAWDYHEMPGLSRELVELKLSIKPNKKHVKQTPRRFVSEITSKIKAEIQRFL